MDGTKQQPPAGRLWHGIEHMEVLERALRAGLNPHRATAAWKQGVNYEEVNRTQIIEAKTANYQYLFRQQQFRR